MADRSVTFRTIYKANRWRGTETRSGPGSTARSTVRLRSILPELVTDLEVTSVLDAACGASFWMPDLPGYIGVDIVPEAVQAVQEAYPERRYEVADICTSDLPRSDLVIARDVLAHLSNAEVNMALDNFRRAEVKWMLLTTFLGAENVSDIRAGSYREYDLEKSPFSLGKSVGLIPDGWWEDSLVYPMKHLGLWRS